MNWKNEYNKLENYKNINELGDIYHEVPIKELEKLFLEYTKEYNNIMKIYEITFKELQNINNKKELLNRELALIKRRI